MVDLDGWGSEALSSMVELGDTLPGSFRAQVMLGYIGGGGFEPWFCTVEGDIFGDGEGSNLFTVRGSSPSEAVARAVESAWARVPPSDRSP